MKKKLLLSLFYCSILVATSLTAQTNAANDNICDEGDCPSTLSAIQLDAPLNPTPEGNYSDQRTQQFKDAWLAFRSLKNSYTQEATWKSKRDESMISGQSCIKHYQLEAHFAHEYARNPSFKKFLDEQGVDETDFKEKGFESSRRGINLSKRMRDKCPQEVKKFNKENKPHLDQLPFVYDKLGKDLGYFDESGKQLKPLKELRTKKNKPNSDGKKKMSKKEQIAQMKDQVAQLPVGQKMKDKIGGITDALGKAKPKLGLFQKALGLLNSKLAGFLPGPLGLGPKIQAGLGILNTLKNFKPRFPLPGLLSKIGDLFKRGKKLADKAKDLVGRSNKLKDQFDNITKKAKDVGNEIGKRDAAIKDLQKQLEELANKKNDLQAKLEDKPKKILEELKQQVGETMKKGKDLVDKVEKESKLKDKLVEKLDQLLKEKDDLKSKLEGAEKEMKDLTKEQEALDKEPKNKK